MLPHTSRRARRQRKVKHQGDLAVWAFVTDLFDLNEILYEKASVKKLPIQSVTAPWATNSNARAQRGVFLALRQFDIELDQVFEPRAHDDVLIESLAEGFGEARAYIALLFRGLKHPSCSDCWHFKATMELRCSRA
jgi:hypothetical protein